MPGKQADVLYFGVQMTWYVRILLNNPGICLFSHLFVEICVFVCSPLLDFHFVYNRATKEPFWWGNALFCMFFCWFFFLWWSFCVGFAPEKPLFVPETSRYTAEKEPSPRNCIHPRNLGRNVENIALCKGKVPILREKQPRIFYFGRETGHFRPAAG